MDVFILLQKEEERYFPMGVIEKNKLQDYIPKIIEKVTIECKKMVSDEHVVNLSEHVVNWRQSKPFLIGSIEMYFEVLKDYEVVGDFYKRVDFIESKLNALDYPGISIPSQIIT